MPYAGATEGCITITACVGLNAVASAANAPLCEQTLQLPLGATINDACSALNGSGATIAADQVCGIWGQVVSRETPLKNGDRLEFYSPLIADPKATRRRRALETPPTNAPEGRSIYARGNKKRRVGTKPKSML